MTEPTHRDQLAFLTYLQRLLTEGGFVATYKYALLLAIADLSVERGDDSGAPLRLTTDQIAEKFIAYYWRQSTPYIPGGGRPEHILLQNTGRPATIISAVAKARQISDGSLSQLQRDAREWSNLIQEVAGIIEKMPLWRLQTFGRRPDERLYSNNRGAHHIELKPGVAFCFRHFHDLVTDLVQGAWIRFVRGLRANQDALGQVGVDLSEFLFGSERADLSAYKPILREIQSGHCFYCRTSLTASFGEIDHFIPWSRYPVDLGHNFVLAHAGCNNSKRDLIAAADHLGRWRERNSRHADVLVATFDAGNLPHNLTASMQITRWAYELAAASGAKVWQQGKVLVPLDPSWRSHWA